MKHLSDDPLYVKLLALPTNNRLVWKGLPGTNTLAYYENLQLTAVKCFKTFALAAYNSLKNVSVKIQYVNQTSVGKRLLGQMSVGQESVEQIDVVKMSVG